MRYEVYVNVPHGCCEDTFRCLRCAGSVEHCDGPWTAIKWCFSVCWALWDWWYQHRTLRPCKRTTGNRHDGSVISEGLIRA